MAEAGARVTGPSDDEATLVARVRAGDLSAFEALIGPYEHRVYRAALRITRDPAAAADVYQDALVAAFERFDTFRSEAAFGSWLHRIAMNCALMRRRAPAHTQVLSEADVPKFNWMGMHVRPVRDWAESAEAPVERAELRRALTAALEGLPEVDRAIVWLKDAEGLAHEDIAAATGLSVSATRSRLHRARLVLRTQLARHVGGER